MRKAIVLAILAIAAPLSVSTLSGATVQKQDPYPNSCDEHSVFFHVQKAKVLIKKAYANDRWRDTNPVKGFEKRHWQAHKRCVHKPAQKSISEYRDKWAAAFYRHRHEEKAERFVQRYLPYTGPNGTHWAIPWSIVACESGGSWSAYNPSGARGPYQFLGWNVPWPVTSERDRRKHHKMAASLYAGGSGASHWAQCL